MEQAKLKVFPGELALKKAKVELTDKKVIVTVFWGALGKIQIQKGGTIGIEYFAIFSDEFNDGLKKRIIAFGEDNVDMCLVVIAKSKNFTLHILWI